MPAADVDLRASISRFVFREMPTIDGYLESQDALIIAALLQEQQRRGFGGSIVDIGVYFGRSYFLFRKLAAPDTKVVGVDLFGLDLNGSGADRYSIFLDNGRRLGLPVDEESIIAADSTSLPASTILQKGGKAGFVSIDGGHSLSHVKADGELARKCLSDHGIMAFDDMHNPLWPEVTVGVADFIRASRGVFCVVGFSRFKSYLCRTEYRDLYTEVLASSPYLKFMEKKEVEYLGSRPLFLRVPIGNRILHALFQHLRLSRLSELAFSRRREHRSGDGVRA
jgi:SAM-dependent methyltransferase